MTARLELPLVASFQRFLPGEGAVGSRGGQNCGAHSPPGPQEPRQPLSPSPPGFITTRETEAGVSLRQSPLPEVGGLKQHPPDPDFQPPSGSVQALAPAQVTWIPMSLSSEEVNGVHTQHMVLIAASFITGQIRGQVCCPSASEQMDELVYAGEGRLCSVRH